MKMRKKILATAIMIVLAMQSAGCAKGQEGETEKPVESSEAADANVQEEEMTVEDSETEELAEEIGVQFIPWEEAGLEDHVMDWKDETLERGMQKITGKISEEERMMGLTCEEEIMLSEVWELTELHLGGDISDISALSELKNLTTLSLTNISASDISALSELKNLTLLSIISSSAVSDISALAELPNLTWLTIQECSVRNIEPLSGLKNLRALNLIGNSVSDISSLSGMTSLMSLELAYNSISDFSIVAELPNLERISCSNNPIEDMSPLEAADEKGVSVLDAY